MIRSLTVAALAVALAAPVAAQTFRAENRVNVTAVAGGFTVENGAGFGARGMWCAAADYARDVLDARGTQRIYVAEDRKMRQRGPVKFTLDSAGLTPSSILILGSSIRTAGANLSVDHAGQFCADSKLVNR
jgi:hypothetical protein